MTGGDNPVPPDTAVVTDPALAAERERRDIVSGEVRDETGLIRFVVGPDETMVPDLARKLPGRGFWVAADRASVELAEKKGLFARAARRKVVVPEDLSGLIAAQLSRRALDQLGLARREGVLISGYEKVRAALKGGAKGGPPAWLIEANDGSADGRSGLLGLARHAPGPVKVCGAFSGEQLSLALGLENAIHAALLAGRRAEGFSREMLRLSGFGPVLPPGWRLDADPENTREPN